MRIIFIKSVVYESEGPNQGPRFEEDETYDCRHDFGDRWVSRGHAEEIEGDFPEPKPPARWVKVDPPKPPKADAKPPAPPTAAGPAKT